MSGPAPVPAPPPPGVLRFAGLPDHVIVVVPEQVDAYSTRPPTAVKTFMVRSSSTTCRIGIRQGNSRAEAVLNAAQLRQLADDLYDRADVIDPPPADELPSPSPTAPIGAQP